MRKNNLSNESAFTLVELLVASVISVIVLGIAFNFLVTTFSLEKSTTEAVDLQQNIRFAMDSIVRELRNTPEIISFNQNKIVFKDGSGSNNVEYYLAGNQLIRNEINNGKGSYSPVANNIIKVSFTQKSNDKNEKGYYFITITLEAKLQQREITMRSNVFLKRAWVEKP